MTIKGFNNQKGLGYSKHVTVQSAGSDRSAIPASCVGMYEVLVATAIASVSQSVDKKQLTIDMGTAHSARVGDFLRMTTGSIDGWEFEIIAVPDSDNVVVWSTSGTLPAATETAEILRSVVQRFNSDGSTIVTIDPAGLATEAKQDAQIVQETATNTKLDTIIAKDFATSAKQDIGNTSLSSIDGKFTTLNAKDFATSAKQDTQTTLLTTIDADTSVLAAVDFSTSAKQDTINASIGSSNTKLDTLIAKDFATSAKQDTGNTSLSSIDGKFTTLNAKDFATSAKQDTQATLTGVVTETAPATDTASSGLNGRLQRIAQRITSLIALLPTSLGQKAMAASLAVTLASDQTEIPVRLAALVPSYQEDLTITDGAVETFTAPAGSKWCKIQADDTNTGNVRVKMGAAATTTSGIQLQPGRSEEFPCSGNVSYTMEVGGSGKLYIQFGV